MAGPPGRVHETVMLLWQRARTVFIRLAFYWGSAFWCFIHAGFLVFLFLSLSTPASFAEGRCDTRAPVQRAELGELSLVYQSVGAPSDPVLLLVMGLGGQLIHWPDDVVEALCRQGFRVVRYDNRDAGLSRWNKLPASANLTVELLRYKLGLPVSAPYTLTDMATDGLRLMDELKVEQFHVLG